MRSEREKSWASSSVRTGCTDPHCSFVTVPFNPTAENLAIHMVEVVGPEVLPEGIVLVECRIERFSEGFDLRHVNLVVLSACKSGAGAPAPGEGLYGLRRAVLQAGARTVISTLWEVGDRSTERLMRRFYDRLFGGASPLEALHGAQLDYLKDARNARVDAGAPAAWGAFVLQGMP